MSRGDSRLRFDDQSPAFKAAQAAFLDEAEGPALEDAYAKLRALVGGQRISAKRTKAGAVARGRYVPSRGARAR